MLPASAWRSVERGIAFRGLAPPLMEMKMPEYLSPRCLPAVTSVVLALLLVSSPFTGLVFASSPAERSGMAVRHAEVPEPSSKAEAVNLLQSSIKKIEDGLARRDFPAIHEASYGVEAALTRIAKEPGYDGVTTSVLPRCEIVHLASELEDEGTLLAAVPMLAKAVQEQLLIQ